MIEVYLDELLNKKEIDDFESFCDFLRNDIELSDHTKKWRLWSFTAKWIDGLSRKEEFIHKTIRLIQMEIMSGYEKIIYPFIREGLIITPILGTLLGMHRQNGLIIHDDDLDLGVDIFSLNKFEKKLRKIAKKIIDVLLIQHDLVIKVNWVILKIIVSDFIRVGHTLL